MKQYVTFSENFRTSINSTMFSDFLSKFSLSGVEVFMDDIVNRGKQLFLTEKEKEGLLQNLRAFCVKRLHCSYWAYPTSFLTGNNFSELISRFENKNAVINYFGDLTGEHMFNRWEQEYILASELQAHSYVFHLIDYGPIDGMWGFTISKNDIRQAMISMLQRFLNMLLEKDLITPESPCIEIENAGWGLEHGIQCAEDFLMLYSQIYDPFHKVKIGWDVNHLLHALGIDRNTGRARFFLPDSEILSEMTTLQNQHGATPWLFSHKWIEHNLLCPQLLEHIGAIHLSDCALKVDEYFTNGKLNGSAYEHICSLGTWEEREGYGVNIVLSEHDSHLVLGSGFYHYNFLQRVLSI